MELYLKIEQAIRQHKSFLYVGNNVTEKSVRHAIRRVMRDYPDIFWFVHQYHFNKDNDLISFSIKNIMYLTRVNKMILTKNQFSLYTQNSLNRPI